MTLAQFVGVIMITFITGVVSGIIAAKHDEKEIRKERLLMEKEFREQLRGRGV